MVFLEVATIAADGSVALGDGLLALIMGIFIAFLIFAVLVYVYLGFAYMAIARKAKQTMPGLSWIPGVGPAIVAFRASKMHWWPWILLAIGIIPIIGYLSSIAFGVFVIIWNWKLFEVLGKPGWWAILLLIPIVNLVMIGIAAWSD